MYHPHAFLSSSGKGRISILLTLLLTTILFASLFFPISSIPTSTPTTEVPTAPTFQKASSKPAVDIRATQKKKKVGSKTLLTLLGLGLGPFFLLSIFSLMFALSSPPFWLFAFLNLIWIVGFGFFFAKTWRIRSKKRKWIAILLASLSSATFTTIVMWLTEYLYFGIFLGVFAQVMLGLLAAGIVVGLVSLGVRWMGGEKNA